MKYIKENLAEFEMCNILRWHQLGYTGKNIKFAEIEGANPNSWIFEGRLKDPFNRCSITSDYNSHGRKVFDCFIQVAPNADIYSLPSGGIYSNNSASGDFIEKTIPYAINNNINIIGASLGGTNNKILNNEILEAQKNGIVFTTSAGNDGNDTDENTLGGYARSDVWISVAALGLRNDIIDIDNIFLKNYSSKGEQLDISMFSGLYVHDCRPRHEDKIMLVEGTSFSQPMIAGMLALVQQFFNEKIGRTLYQDEVVLFIQDHVIDLGEEGHDKLYGHGLFVLPEPSDIIVDKYIIHKTIEIDMWIDNHIFQINKISKVSDVAPQIIDDRTFVPIRWVSENLGATVYWDNKEYKVTIITSNNEVILFIDKNEYYINGVKKYMDVCPIIKSDRTLVPIRFVAEALGCEVFWNDKERKVKIIKW